MRSESSRDRHPGHLINAGISFVGLITCAVMAGELVADCTREEENFPDVPDAAKPFLAVMFLGFAALEANKVRSRLTRARGFR